MNASQQAILRQQQLHTELSTFLTHYFTNEDHFLLSEADFILLERTNSACTALCALILDSNSTKSLSVESLANLITSCVNPLKELLANIHQTTHEAEKQATKIKQLAENMQ